MFSPTGESLVVTPLRDLKGNIQVAWVHLEKIFNKLVEQKLLKYVLYDRKITSAAEFWCILSTPNNTTCIIEFEGDIVALFWLNDSYGTPEDSGVSAQIHYVFFKEAWGDVSLNITRLVLYFMLSAENETKKPMFKVIRGVTPNDNPLAIKMLKRIGMKLAGVIPCGVYNAYKNKLVDATYSYITKELLEEKMEGS